MSYGSDRRAAWRISVGLTAWFTIVLVLVSVATFLLARVVIGNAMERDWETTRSGVEESWRGEPGMSARELRYWQSHDRAAPTPAIREVVERHFDRAFVPLVLAIVGLGVVAGLLLTYWFTRPLRDLGRTVREILETGELSRRVPRRRIHGELDELVGLINLMVERNEKLIGTIRDALDNVAHDLRTPLTRLRGTAEHALADPGDGAASQEALADCLEESDEILRLLDTLMDVAEARTGVMHLELQPLALHALLVDVAELYELVAEERRIRVTVAEGEATVIADRSRLRQVFANLLDNALKFSESGSAIHLAVRAEGDAAVATVTDQGPGIATEDLDRIWERLYRGDRSRSVRGLGLGLSFVKAVVEAHGGAVAVTSRLGEGATFTVRLPTAT